jgi:hypothetical protein
LQNRTRLLLEGAQSLRLAATSGTGEGRKGTCGDGEDCQGKPRVGGDPVEPGGCGVHRRLVRAEGSGEEAADVVAGGRGGGGWGLDLHEG